MYPSKLGKRQDEILSEPNNDAEAAIFEDILDTCTSLPNSFGYKANEGIKLWSKCEFDSILSKV